mgnify:CR=1 FL=1
MVLLGFRWHHRKRFFLIIFKVGFIFYLLANCDSLSSIQRDVIVPICLILPPPPPAEESVSILKEYSIDLSELAIVFTDLLTLSYILELESEIDSFILLPFLLVELCFSLLYLEVIEIPLVLERENIGRREH